MMMNLNDVSSPLLKQPYLKQKYIPMSKAPMLLMVVGRMESMGSSIPGTSRESRLDRSPT